MSTDNHHYIILPDHSIKCVPLMEWAQWFEERGERTVGKTRIWNAEVSTMFLGLDHRFWWEGPPIIFETMIFGDGYNSSCREYCERYCTWEEAMLGHKRACAWVKHTQWMPLWYYDIFSNYFSSNNLCSLSAIFSRSFLRSVWTSIKSFVLRFRKHQ